MANFEPGNPDYAAVVRTSFHSQPFMSHLGARLISVAPGRCEIGLDNRLDLAQQHGYIHGGAIGTIIDTAMGYAGFSLAEPGSSVLTVEYKLNFVAPADGESLIARGQVVRPGRTLVVNRGEVFSIKDGVETLCAVATQTLMILAGRTDG